MMRSMKGKPLLTTPETVQVSVPAHSGYESLLAYLCPHEELCGESYSESEVRKATLIEEQEPMVLVIGFRFISWLLISLVPAISAKRRQMSVAVAQWLSRQEIIGRVGVEFGAALLLTDAYRGGLRPLLHWECLFTLYFRAPALLKTHERGFCFDGFCDPRRSCTECDSAVCGWRLWENHRRNDVLRQEG